MHLPLEYRVEAVLRFIQSGFKLEETIAWFLDKYSHLDTVVKSANPRTLIRNIVTMGGRGWNLDLNIVAFDKAMAIVVEQRIDEVRAETKVVSKRVAELERQRDRQLVRIESLQSELYETKDRVHASEKEALMLKASV